MKKSNGKFFLFLLISGLVFLCVAIILTVNETEFQRDGKQIQAEIVRIDRETDDSGQEVASVYVEYTVDDETYTQKLDYYSSDFSVGATVYIYYLPDNPTSVSYVGAQPTSPDLFYVCAAICFVFSVFFGVPAFKGRVNIKRLKESGRKVTAIVKKFENDKNTRTGGKRYATLTCADVFGHTYKTKVSCDYEGNFIVGDYITVYVDASDESKYAIDIQGYLSGKRR